MKQLIALVMLAFSCTLSSAADALSSVAWLQGCWAVEGGEPGSGEQWSAPAGGAMVGVGRTVRGGKQAHVELLQLREMDGKLAYVVLMPGQAEVAFALRPGSGDDLVFENTGHDFPQRIVYRKLAPSRVHARIEGVAKGQPRTVDFPMRRVSCDT